jgi:hypothetical protein
MMPLKIALTILLIVASAFGVGYADRRAQPPAVVFYVYLRAILALA